MRVCSSTDSTKNIYADLNLKELLIRQRPESCVWYSNYIITNPQNHKNPRSIGCLPPLEGVLPGKRGKLQAP